MAYEAEAQRYRPREIRTISSAVGKHRQADIQADPRQVLRQARCCSASDPVFGAAIDQGAKTTQPGDPEE